MSPTLAWPNQSVLFILQALIRGAYVNTASKDVGIDPDYHKYKVRCPPPLAFSLPLPATLLHSLSELLCGPVCPCTCACMWAANQCCLSDLPANVLCDSWVRGSTCAQRARTALHDCHPSSSTLCP